MANGPLTNALQNYLMGKQARQQQTDRDRQIQSREMLGQMLQTGQAPEGFAQLNPEAYMMGSQEIARQRGAESQASQNALIQQLRQEYAQSQDPAVLRQLVAVDPEAAGQIRQTMGAMDEEQSQSLINQATAFAQVVRNQPDQAMEYFNENLADVPAFQDLADELAAGDYQSVLDGIGVGITALGGQEAYDAFTGADSKPEIGTYNPRDYTPASFAEFQSTGDPGVLKRYYPLKRTEIAGTTYFSDDEGNLYLPASPKAGGPAQPTDQDEVAEPAGPGVLTGEQQTEQEARRAAEIESAKAEAKQEAEAATPEAQERRKLKEQEAERTLNLVDRLLKSDNLSKITGPETAVPVVGGVQSALARDELNDLKALGNLLTMGNLGRMTGVLSESDIRLISSAASGMDIGESGTTISEDRLREILGEIKDRISERLNSGESMTEDDADAFINSVLGGQ